MQITLSRKTLLVALLVIAVILLIVSFLFPEKGESAAAEATRVIPDAMATIEDRIRTPRAWTMTDGVQAVTGRATFLGEDGDVVYVTVQSGELKFTFMVTPRTGVFSTADMRPNQPAPTVENPRNVLRNLYNTPVLVRYEPGDPPRVYSILIGCNQ